MSPDTYRKAIEVFVNASEDMRQRVCLSLVAKNPELFLSLIDAEERIIKENTPKSIPWMQNIIGLIYNHDWIWAVKEFRNNMPCDLKQALHTINKISNNIGITEYQDSQMSLGDDVIESFMEQHKIYVSLRK